MPVLPPKHRQVGFTLIELLVTVTLLALVIILALMAWRNNINKANDARRKADLEKIKIAFENYYNDKGCFPPEDVLQTCHGDTLKPYLQKIPCDPVFDLPYCYIHDSTDSCGQNYKVLATLKVSDDQAIKKLLCDTAGIYCGYETNCANTAASYEGFNYGVSSGNIQVYNPAVVPTPSPSPSTNPSPSPSHPPVNNYNYACQPPDGNCNNYNDPISAGCPTWNAQSNPCTSGDCCLGACDDPNNWCSQ